MPAGLWTPTNTAREKILRGQFDFDSDTFKCGLALSTSNLGAASTTYAALTNEHANANGYVTGGVAVAFTLAGTTSVTMSFTSNPIWVASGGPITARSGFIYEVGGDIVGFVLLDAAPADVTAPDGQTLTIDADGSPQPVFTLG